MFDICQWRSTPLDGHYQPLMLGDDKTSQIRLLTLAPGRPKDPIRLTLSVHNVENLPPYEALSYVWGTGGYYRRRRVDVNGYKLHITSNLETALLYLRHKKEPRVLWIDAICIDQRNTNERNHQVQLMKLIYSKAIRIVVFLGHQSENDGSDIVFDNMTRDDKDTIEEPDFVDGLDQLLRRPWFYRAWVVQEVVLAAEAVIQCGNKQVPFSTFLQVVEHTLKKLNHQLYANNQYVLSVDWCDELANRLTITKETNAASADLRRRAVLGFLGSLRNRCLEVNNLKNFRAGTYGEHFAALYYWTWNRRATDPRDKVFSLLGMYERSREESANSVPCQLVADYTKSTESVYAEAMAVIIADGFQFGYPILPLRTRRAESAADRPYLGAPSRTTAEERQLDLPSWVPDLQFRDIYKEEYGVTTASRALIRPDDPRPIQQHSDAIIGAIHDSSKIHQKNAFSNGFRTLHAQGKHMGVVIASCPLEVTSLYYARYQTPDECRETFMDLLRKFCSGKTLSKRALLVALMAKDVDNMTVDTALPMFEMYLEHKDPLTRYKESTVDLMWDALGCCAQGRTIFVTDTERVGMSMGELEPGDLLVGLFGIMYPVILRKAEADTYTMLNVAHVAEHTLGHTCDCGSPTEGESEEENRAKCGHRIFTIV